MIHPACEACSERSNTKRHERLNVSIMHSGRMIQWGHLNEASLPCHTGEQVHHRRSSCAAAYGAYIWHVRWTGVVYNSSLFHISCTGARERFWSLQGSGVGGGPLCQTAGSVWCFTSGGLSVRSYFRSTCLCLFRHMSFMDFHPLMLA